MHQRHEEGGGAYSRLTYRLLWRSHINPGSSRASSKPIPQAGTVRMSSQPSKGVPSSSSPVRHASVSPKAMPVFLVRKCETRHLATTSAHCGNLALRLPPQQQQKPAQNHQTIHLTVKGNPYP